MRSGIINVYKEAGYTSFDVVAKLRGILHIKKIGHTGTLDPDATGVLPVCIGKATKVCDMLTNTDKTYTATLLLGQATDTYDISGNVTKTSSQLCTPEGVCKTIESFQGDILQVPPMYSALKVNGKKLYELARKGIEVERKPRPVTIYNIDIISIDLPRVTFQVRCSKGTYIRSLCNDIGEQLGCFGCMESLVRDEVGEFKLEDALKLSEIEALVRDDKIEEVLVGVDDVFSTYPKCYVKHEFTKMCLNGAKLPINSLVDTEINYSKGDYYRLYLQDEAFVGVYKLEQNLLRLEKMFYESI